jgi:hypothetical protein
MKETVMKRVLNVVCVFALSVFWTACHDGPPIQERQDMVAVSFSVVGIDTDARTVLPQLSLADAASYQLLGGRNGDAETVLIESFTGTGTFVTLAGGTWNFTLNAYNGDGGHILRGTVSDKLIAVGNEQVRFIMVPVKAGTGAIQITLNFPASAGITRIETGGDIDPQTFAIANAENFVYAKDTVAAGDHVISFKLYRDSVLRAVVSELVLVRGGWTSSATITIAGDDLKPVLRGSVSIIGTAAVGQTLAADTYYLEGTGDVGYQWKLNGVAALGTESTYTVKATDVGGFITVTVTRNNYDGDITSAAMTVRQ